MSTPAPLNCTALVVGAGPVGLTMAAHLHHHGVACRIIDKAPAATDKSKALVLWGRSLEMLESLGLIDQFTATGMFANGSRFWNGDQVLARFTLETEGTHYPRPLLLPQSETERLLTEHLKKARILVERPVELTAFTDTGAGVTATLRHADGHDEQIQCDWLLGCDGAHSMVRHLLGMGFTGEAEPNDWVLADCRIAGPIPMDEVNIFWHASGVLAFFPFTPSRCRVIADMGTAKGMTHPADPTLADIQALVNQRGPAGVILSEPHWLAGFRIHERKVADYRRGRVFLAGDAAHIHSPAGGQGMNTGMQDAWNLVWKVALVQSGKARPTLLDSYTPERSTVGAVVLREAGRMTTVSTLRNPVAQFVRNQAIRLLTQLPVVRRNFVRYLAEMTVHYPESPLNGETLGAGWARFGTAPGDRFPDERLRDPVTGKDERLFHLLLGTTHNLLLLPAAGDTAALAWLAEIRKRVDASFPGLVRSHLIVVNNPSAAQAAGFEVAWIDSEEKVRQALGARETALALIRPDGYLAFRGQPASFEELRQHLERYLVPQTGG